MFWKNTKFRVFSLQKPWKSGISAELSWCLPVWPGWPPLHLCLNRSHLPSIFTFYHIFTKFHVSKPKFSLFSQKFRFFHEISFFKNVFFSFFSKSENRTTFPKKHVFSPKNRNFPNFASWEGALDGNSSILHIWRIVKWRKWRK